MIPLADRKRLVDQDDSKSKIIWQCEMLGINRSSLYYKLAPVRLLSLKKYFNLFIFRCMRFLRKNWCFYFTVFTIFLYNSCTKDLVSSVTINGTVQDCFTENPVSASIILQSSKDPSGYNPENIASVLSNANGSFQIQFSRDPQLYYDIYCFKSSYLNSFSQVIVGGNNTISLSPLFQLRICVINTNPFNSNDKIYFPNGDYGRTPVSLFGTNVDTAFIYLSSNFCNPIPTSTDSIYYQVTKNNITNSFGIKLKTNLQELVINTDTIRY